MTVLEAIILGAIQGLTEFLPVSSSGHLVLGRELLGIESGAGEESQAITVSVLVHLGSLLAILAAFRNDIVKLARPRDGWRTWIILVVASLPAAIIGIGMKVLAPKLLDQYEASAWVACFGLLFTCLVLTAVVMKLKRDRSRPVVEDQSAPMWGNARKTEVKTALAVGVAQLVAITPGVSRSGSTISTALMLGWNQIDAVRLSFLMGMIAIGGAGLIEARNISNLDPVIATAAFLSSLAFSLLGIWAIKRIVARSKFGWFAIYTGVVGTIGLIVLATQ